MLQYPHDPSVTVAQGFALHRLTCKFRIIDGPFNQVCCRVKSTYDILHYDSIVFIETLEPTEAPEFVTVTSFYLHVIVIRRVTATFSAELHGLEQSRFTLL
jgi:hypothetical protein